jgi:hypothetical protein
MKDDGEASSGYKAERRASLVAAELSPALLVK